MEIDKVNYWESREVNIGHYEKVSFGLSFTSTVRHINQVDKTLKISHAEVISLSDDKEAFSKSVSRAMNRVKAVLNKRESEIRSNAAAFDSDDILNHLEKLAAAGIEPMHTEAMETHKKKKKKRTKLSKRLEDIDDDEI